MAASARFYCGGQLLQARFFSPCRACLVAHPWQLVPYAALGLGRDGANNLASSRLESWGLDDTSVANTPYSVLDSTKWCTICDQTIISCVCGNIIKYRLKMMPIL